MLYQEYLTTFWQDYSTSILVFLAFFISFAIFQKIIVWRLEYLAKKTTTDIDDAVIRIVKSINPPFYFFLAIYISSRFIETSPQFNEYLRYAVIAVIVFQLIQAGSVFVDYLVDRFSKFEDRDVTSSAVLTLGKVSKSILWIVGFLVVLQNLGIQVTSIIAGLGIGGIAVALAAQNVLGDLFASFSIIFDKPFRTGDFIQIGDSLGEVKKIGIKTTRLQALQGEELIIGNKELTSNKIQNYGRMKKRRSVINVGIVYETPKSKLKKAKTLLRKAIKNQEKAELDRVNLKELGDSALIFECVYFVTTDDYNVYMDIREDINMEIIEEFEKEGIEFAYPTQIIYQKNI